MFSRPIINGPPIFVIGSQRSGTTWVGNVLNRSADVLFFYEPFQVDLGIFDFFPNDGIFVQNPSSGLVDSIRSQHESLLALNEKYFPLNRFTRYMYAKSIRSFSKIKHPKLTQLIVVNQWSQGNIREHLVKKNRLLRPLIKETRLHLKLNLLSEAFPDGKIVLLLRHPYPVVTSTLKWMERGHLQETKRKIQFAHDVFRCQEEVREAMPEAVEMTKGSLKEALVAQWFIMNELAIKEKPKTVVYESICKKSDERYHEIFKYAGLEITPAVRDYIRASSLSPVNSTTITGTYKNSSMTFNSWLPDDREIMNAVDKLSSNSRAFQIVAEEYV